MPGYLENFYQFIKSNDPSYESKYSLDGFTKRMDDPEYVKKINAWASNIDPNFDKRLREFSEPTQPPVQKKNSLQYNQPPQDGSESPSPFGISRFQQASPTDELSRNIIESGEQAAKKKSLEELRNIQKRKPYIQPQQPMVSESTGFVKKELEQRIEIEKGMAEAEGRQIAVLKSGIQREKGYVPELPKNAIAEIDKLSESDFEGSEEYVVPKLEYIYGAMGFRFEEAGPGTNRVKVTAPLGSASIEIPINQGSVNNKKSAEKLNFFLKRWGFANFDVDKLQGYYQDKTRKFRSQQEVDSEIANLNKKATDYNSRAQQFVKDSDDFQAAINALNAIPVNQRTQDNYISKMSALNQQKESLLQRQRQMVADQASIKSDEESLKVSVGSYSLMKGEQGTWYGSAFDELRSGMGSWIANSTKNVMSRVGGAYNFFEYYTSSDKTYVNTHKEELLAKAKEMGIKLPEATDYIEKAREVSPGVYESAGKQKVVGQTDMLNWWNSLDDDTKDQLSDYVDDQSIKSFLYSPVEEGGPSMQTVLREAPIRFTGGRMSTPEYTQSIKENNFIGGALLGVVNSAPSFLGGNRTSRVVRMFNQAEDGAYQEMENNPDFKNVSEQDKRIFASTIGAANAALEEIGISNVINKSGFINKIVTKTLTDAGENATAKSLSEIIKNDIKSGLAKGTLTLANGFLAEAETGATQQVAEFTLKDAFNAYEDKKMFKTPDTWGEYVSDVLKSGVQEGIGGFVLSAPGAVSAAYRKQGFLGLSDKDFKIFEASANDINFRKALITNLKLKVNSAEMTPSEAKDQLNDYDNSVSLYRALPEGLDTQSKKEAMNLIRKKRELQQAIEGKDEALVKKQKEKIAEIDSQLNKLSEDAIQKQATDESLLRGQGPKLELPKVGEGNVQPQATTAGTQEAITPQVKEEITSRVGEIQTALKDETADVTEEQKAKMQEEMNNLKEQQTKAAEQSLSTLNEDQVNEIGQKNGVFSAEDELSPAEKNKRIVDAYVSNDNTSLTTDINNIQPAPVAEVTTTAIATPEQQTQAKQMLMDNLGVDVTFNEDGTFEVPEFVDEGKSQYDKDLSIRYAVNALTDAGYTPSQNINVEEYALPVAETTAKQGRNRVEVMRNVIKSLGSILPNLSVQTFGSVEEMKQFAEQNYGGKTSSQILGGEGGVIIYDENNQPAAILINESKADVTTMPHEAWHAIFFKAFGDNKALFKEFRDSIDKTLRDNGYSNIADQLNDFSNQEGYIQSDTQAEEYMVQLGGLLTSSGITPDNLTQKSKTLLTQIKDVINKFAMKILGQPVFLEDATPESILSFMVSISDKMSRGEDISSFFKNVEQKATKGEPTVKAQLTQQDLLDAENALAILNEGKSPEEIKRLISKNRESLSLPLYFEDTKLEPINDKAVAVIYKGKQIGVMQFDPKVGSGQYVNPLFDKSKADPYSSKGFYGDILGRSTQEAASEIIRRYEGPTVKAQLAKQNLIQNSEGVGEAKPKAGSVGVGGDVVGELSPLQKELQKANAPQKLIDAVPKETKLREGFLTDTKRLVESLLGLAGNFSIKENKVRIGKFYSALFGGRDMILIHEAAHAATMFVYGDILRNEGDYTKEQVAAARELNDIAWQYMENTSTAAKMTFPRLYGTTNPYEFIAEFIANPKFRDYVAENSPSKKTNVVNYIWDCILRMFGIKKSEINQELIDKIQAGIDATLEVSAAKNKPVEQSLKETPKAGSVGVGEIKTVKAQLNLAEGPFEQEIKSIPGYDRMMEQVNGIVTKAGRRGADNKRTMDAVMNYVTKSEVYNRANDSQREQIVRNIKEQFGQKIKAAPSVKKILGLIQDVKKVTVNEMTLIKKAIKDMNKGAKNAIAAWRSANAELAESLKDMQSKGKITIKQVVAVIKKFSKVNMLDDRSIDKFTNYMSKVFADAEYADKIGRAKAMIKNAKKAVKTKIGVASSVSDNLQKMLSISPDLIPDAAFDDYMTLLEMLSQRQAELDLIEIGEVSKMVENVLDKVNEEESMVDELSERFDNYDDKVFDKDGNMLYTDTIDKMLEEGIINKKEHEVMTKYRSDISPIERTPKTEEEIEDENESMRNYLLSTDIDIYNLPTKDERDLARKIRSMINATVLKSLNNSQLKNLMRVVNNINNGYISHYAQIISEKMEASSNAAELTDAIQNASTLPISRLYSRIKSFFTKKNSMLEYVRRTPLAYIDQIFGNFKTKTIFKSIYEKSAQAMSVYRSQIDAVRSRLNNAQDAVAKSFGQNGNKIMRSKFKMSAYLLQKEYLSNPENKKMHSAYEFMQKTISHILSGNSRYTERDAKMLQGIIDEYRAKDDNGNDIDEIDINKLYDSFNEAELNAIETVEDINKSLTEKAAYTAAVIRGNKMSPINNYVHHSVLYEHSADENVEGASHMKDYNDAMRPSTKAKSLIERTGKVTPLDFDIFSSAYKGANYVLLDYHMTDPIRTARRTLNDTERKLQDDGTYDKKTRDIFNAIKNSYEEAVDLMLNDTFISTSLGDDIVNEISRQGYRSVLASVPRFVSELNSNIAYAVFTDPLSFGVGMKYFNVYSSSDGVDVMNNVKSKQIGRVFHGDTLSGRMIDSSILKDSSGIRGGKSRSYISNKLQQIYNRSLKKYKNFVEATADTLISTPDKMVARPIWFGTFATEFKKITGNDVDFEKIAKGDEIYMNFYKREIDQARDFADSRSVMAGATQNTFMDMLKGKTKKDQSVTLRAFNNFNNFMTKFMIYEYSTARTAVMAAIGRGDLTKAQGALMLAGVVSRMTVYSVLTSTTSALMVKAFGGGEDEPEDERSLLDKVKQGLMSSASSMLFARDFGNSTRTVVNYGLEWVNEKYSDYLRDKPYDYYKDAIAYSAVPRGTEDKKPTLIDYIISFSGSYSPMLKTVNFAVKKYTQSEEDKKKEEEGENINDKLERENFEKQLQGRERRILDYYGYATKDQMKKGNPALYEKKLGPNSIQEKLRAEYKKEVEKASEKEEKKETRKKEIGVRIPLEVLGNLGYVPLYKDVRKITLANMYKGIDKAEKEESVQKEIKEKSKEILKKYGFGSREDMKRYAPTLYEKEFGEKSEIYKLEQPIRNANKVKEDLMKRIKNEYYDYIPRRSGSGLGGSTGLGGSKGVGGSSGVGGKSGIGGSKGVGG